MNPLVCTAVRHRLTPSLDVRVETGSRHLQLAGEFDVVGVDAFTAAVSPLTEGAGGAVVVDLRSLRFVDAAALGAFVRLRNALNRVGDDLHLFHASAQVTKVFAAAGLSSLLPPPPPPATAG